MPVWRAVVLPVSPTQDEDITFIESVVQEQRAAYVQHQLRRQGGRIDTVSQSARAMKEKVFHKWGVEAAVPGAGSSITFCTLHHIGADLLYSPLDPIDIEGLQNDLGEAFLVAPDSRLTMERSHSKQQFAGQPEAFGVRYPQSNIAAAHRSRDKAKRPLRGHNVLVAVLDSGVDADHAEFGHRRRDDAIAHAFVASDDHTREPVEGRGFDLGGHGTHVASIIGGRNGVAPHSLVCAASSSPHVGNQSRMVMFTIGLDWLFSKITDDQNFNRRAIINLSIGLPDVTAPDGLSRLEISNAREAFVLMLQSLIKLDVLVVTSVGNDPGTFSSPADVEGVLAVGAVDSLGALARFSGRRVEAPPKPDVLGFGVDVVGASRRPFTGDHLYETRSGTSQAAAYISGLAALYWQKFSDVDSAGIKRALTESVIPPAGKYSPAHAGRGIAVWDRKWVP